MAASLACRWLEAAVGIGDFVMNRLSTYVGAILHRQGAPAFSSHREEHSSEQDQGIEVRREVVCYRFGNGVVIRRTVEQDDFPSALACAECWITYEVVASGDVEGGVRPVRKRFENSCREAFWQAYHAD